MTEATFKLAVALMVSGISSTVILITVVLLLTRKPKKEHKNYCKEVDWLLSLDEHELKIS